MTETVTDIIVARSRQSEGLQPMVLWSTAGHVLLMAALLLSGGRVIEDRQEPVMTISLGGAFVLGIFYAARDADLHE